MSLSCVPPARVSERLRALWGDYLGAINVNIGCGRNVEPGFVNVDRRPALDGVLRCELGVDRIPCGDGWMPSNSVDCVLASHVLEHIPDLIGAMREIHRVLKPGGYLIAVTPYASSDDAWEDPTHVRAFTANSWGYFDRRLYDKRGHAGSYQSDVDYCFEIVRVDLVPYRAVLDRAWQTAKSEAEAQGLIDEWRQRHRNVISEMHAVLRKVEA